MPFGNFIISSLGPNLRTEHLPLLLKIQIFHVSVPSPKQSTIKVHRKSPWVEAGFQHIYLYVVKRHDFEKDSSYTSSSIGSVWVFCLPKETRNTHLGDVPKFRLNHNWRNKSWWINMKLGTLREIKAWRCSINFMLGDQPSGWNADCIWLESITKIPMIPLLVGGFNKFWKNISQIGSFPQVGVKIIFETTT